MLKIRIVSVCVILILGFLLPYWILFLGLAIGAVFFKNFWEAILITTILNIVYTYNGASFEATYIIWGIVVYLLSVIIHSRTRFHSYLQRKDK